MKRQKRSKKKMVIIVVTAVVLCAALAVGAFSVYGNIQMKKLPGLSFADCMEYTNGGDTGAVITVGILKDGQMSYKVYGEDGKELPAELHTYEIGSITKTLTAALINKAIGEGKISLDGTIDEYLDLPEGNNYPSIKELLTHTSGYKSYYLDGQMIRNTLTGRNSFYGVGRDKVLSKAASLSMDKDSHGFEYSNFGFAVLGLVLEAVYDEDYTTLLNDFVQNELGMKHTHISDMNGDLGNYWEWIADDAYIPAGAVTSDIEDMLLYAQLQLDGDERFLNCHKSLKKVNASDGRNAALGIRIDEVGMSWIIDDETGIIWHNGGTGHYNSYLGFDKENGTAVVILSNLGPSYRIPATVLGVKLMNELADG